MTGAFLAGVLAGYAIAIPVGAIAVLILETGIRHGLRPAAAAGAGAASADLVYATVAVLGGSAMAALVDHVDDALRLIASGVLLAIGVRGLLRAGRGPGMAPSSTGRPAVAVRRTYLRFVALTMLNPVTVAYFGALMLGLPALANEPIERAAFVAGAFLASLSWQLGLAAAGALAHRRLTPRLEAGLGVLGSLVIIAFAIGIAARA